MGRMFVPFGTNPEDYEFTKGVIIMYDTFDNNDFSNIERTIKIAEERDFDKIILYPLHEKTSRRIDVNIRYGYKDRVKALEDFALHADTDVEITVCKLEGKRSKYTPIDTALAFITEHHKGPYFLHMSDYMANQFSTFSTFDKWIKEVRLMIYNKENERLTTKLEDKRKRWEWI